MNQSFQEMKKNRRSPALSFGVLMLFILPFQACFNIRTPVLESVENFSLGRENRGPLTLRVDLLLHNPNGFGLSLKKARGQVWLEGEKLGDFRSDTLVRIRAGQDFVLPLRMELAERGLLGNTLSLLLNEEVEFQVKGSLKAGKYGLYMDYPIDYRGKQRPGDWMR